MNTDGEQQSSNKRNTGETLFNSQKSISDVEKSIRFISQANAKSKYTKIRKITKKEGEGPLYLETEQVKPLVLYRPQVEEVWNKETNPQGYVPVVLNPELKSGKSGKLDLMREQEVGVQFLWDAYWNGKGCILAHEMGLGKTRTAISLILTLLEQSPRSKGKSRPGLSKCIVLAPKNAVPVWQQEFIKWTPRSIKPPNPKAIQPGQKDSWDVVNQFPVDNSCNILILSYDSFRKHISNFEEGFSKYKANSIDLVICDEAHLLKNESTKRSKSLKQFKAAKIWIGMTGTLYQNNLEEFCNLIHFFQPEIFGTSKYKEEFCKPITNQFKKAPKLDDRHHKLLCDLKALILPAVNYMWNNLKVDKHEMIVCAPLNGGFKEDEGNDMEIQHHLYKRLTETFSDRNKKSKISLYERLQYLGKACIHPTYLYEAMKKKQSNFLDLIEFYENQWPSPEILKSPDFRFETLKYSGKIHLLLEMVSCIYIDNIDDKVVIVSSSRVVLSDVKEAFTFLNYQYVEYNGDKSEQERFLSLKRFNEERDVRFILLSLKAGGTALTLVQANHMILMDPDWNPAIDKQALARIYRPGQTKTVYVYRLLATGTIEETKFINQLGKEEFDSFLKDSSEDKRKVQVPFGETDLLVYYPHIKSRIRQVLDKLKIDEFNDETFEAREFADDLSRCKQYSEVHHVPDTLPVLQKVWEGHISYVFHTAKVGSIVNVDDLLVEMLRK